MTNKILKQYFILIKNTSESAKWMERCDLFNNIEIMAHGCIKSVEILVNIINKLSTKNLLLHIANKCLQAKIEPVIIYDLQSHKFIYDSEIIKVSTGLKWVSMQELLKFLNTKPQINVLRKQLEAFII